MLVATSAALAQSSSFVYQGRLTDGGTAANGNYDLQFSLFDSLSGGTQVGSTQTLNTVAVSNGVFTVSLDFGANAFPGASRFLEISARPAGAGSFTLLTPRQPITSTPYAVRSLNAASADSVPANGISAGSGNYIQNSSATQSSSNFNISGNGLAGGTLSGNVVNATTQYNLNGSRILSNPGFFNLLVGDAAGAANTGGANNTFVGKNAALNNTTGNANSFFGSSAGATNTGGTLNAFFGFEAGKTSTRNFNTFFGATAGDHTTTGEDNSFFGEDAGSSNTTGTANTIIGSEADVGSGNLTNATAIGAFARVDASNALVLGRITPAINVGIGTTAPTKLFHLKGPGSDFAGAGDLLVTGTGTVGSAITLEATGSGGHKYSWISTASAADPGGGALAALDVTNTAYRMVINSLGNVGIGTTAPLDRLHVFGDIRVGVTGTNGCLKNNNGGTITGTCSSDVRFKRDVSPFPNLLNKVTQLRPVHYYWRATEFPEKGFGDERSYGLVAQEVEKVLPELVSQDAEGYKAVDYSKLPLMLLQAIKEQQMQIQQQRELIERQQALAARQQQQLNALKKLACRSHRRARVCR